MKTIKYLTALICACALCLNVHPVFAEEEPENIQFNSEYVNEKVVYSYDKDETGITNGRIAVTYNENELTLLTVKNGEKFDVEDVNQKEEAKDGMKTIYFAFASAEAVTKEGNVLKLEFSVNPSMKGKDVTITTDVEELNNGETVVEMDQDTDTVSIPKDNPNPGDKEDNKNDNADTSDQFNLSLYAGLAMLAIGAGVIVIFQKKGKLQ